jgi:type IV pilus assembly protein PilY1
MKIIRPYTAAFLCLSVFVNLLHAQVAQAPLVAGTAAVPPNLVFTIDDSGSMLEQCIPDGRCGSTDFLLPPSISSTTITGSVTFSSTAPTTTITGTVTTALKVVSSNSAFVSSMRTRSVAFNSQYYNPAVTYTPWRNADGSYFPASPPTAAPLNPRQPSVTFSLVDDRSFVHSFCKGSGVNTDLPDTCAIGTETFKIAHYYNLTSGSGGNAVDFTRVNIYAPTVSFPKDANRTDCAGSSTCTLTEEQQNFANWFTYSRDKLFSAIGGTANAFYNVPSEYRLGYGSINQASTSIDGVNTQTLKRGLRPFTGTDKTSFYTWLHAMTTPGGTPLRRAMGDVGEYFRRTDNMGPWGAVPGTNDTTPHLACRRAFHILMTDGQWNGAAATNAAAQANVDGTTATAVITGSNGQTFRFTPIRPFSDTRSNTLADVAMYYWLTDLRPDLPNSVKSSSEDPAFWQHMVNYTIAFGQNGALTFPTDLPALKGEKTPVKDWGTNEIDDLWHAAVNSRGLYASAASQKAYADAITTIITNIDDRNGSDAGVAVSGRALGAGTRKFTPEYTTNKWSGELSSISLDSSTGQSTGVVWRASDSMPAAASRQIFTFKDSTTKGISFTWASLTAQSMTSTLAVTAVEGTGLVNYLRGDRTGEGSTYRARSKVLGDIVNSSPALVKDIVDMQYDFMATGTAGKTTYREYLRNKKFRTGQVFVGANDGMLHAFSEVDGVETFAFMPRTVLGGVKALSIAPYDHRYFVDGPVAEVDIYDSLLGGTGWRSLVIGSGGAGAKNIFAINAPVPSSPVGSATLTVQLLPPAAADILWEINSTSATFADLGHLLQTPEAGLMRDGQWAVIFGNGYDSSTGRAQLFIVNALTGALIKKIDTGIPTSGGGNGLGGVRVVRDSQLRIVSAYAGDLLGNLWKFDLSGSTVASWGVAFGSTAAVPKPLFKAVNRNGQAEPIVAAPAYVLHPRGGVQLLLGSGKLFATGDQNNIQERTLYGLWDNVAVGADSSAAANAISGTTTLVLQQISTTVSISVGSPAQTVTYYTSTNNTVDYATKRGWIFPLTIQSGQRMTYDPQVSQGLVFFETIVPGGAAATCENSTGAGYNFAFDPLSGRAQTGGATFDTNADGVIDSSDNTAAVIYKTIADGSDAILFKPAGKSGGVIVDTSGGRLFNAPPNTIKRSWRQLTAPPN